MTRTIPAYLARLMQHSGTNLRLPPEDRLCRDFTAMLRAWTIDGSLRAVWTHPANELAGGLGKSSQIRYAKAKTLGMIVGASDYLFLSPNACLALEAKAGRNSLTEGQTDFRLWCADMGVPFAIFKTVEEGQAALVSCGLLKDRTQ